jgi:hypothetical protein
VYCSVELFLASKQLTDVLDCRDLTSLQSLVFLIIFLQGSSKVSACYTYLGIAIKAAVRMGLHRRVSRSVNPIERETRRRLFWVLRKMDIYVSTVLGLPRSIADDDIDQEFPLDLDDESIRENGVSLQLGTRPTQMTATIAHIRLMMILKQVTTDVYPIKGVEQGLRGGLRVYFIDQLKIREIEESLRRWSDSLSEAFKALSCGSEQFSRHVSHSPLPVLYTD